MYIALAIITYLQKDLRSEIYEIVVLRGTDCVPKSSKQYLILILYTSRWLGTIDEDYNVKIEEYYNRETEPYRYEGSLDLETGEIMGKYNKNTIQGIFKFTLSATL